MKLFVTEPAGKDLRKLDKQTRERVEEALDRLLIHPDKVDVRKLQGKKDFWRLRIGDYRVILRSEEENLFVMRVRHRREAYR